MWLPNLFSVGQIYLNPKYYQSIKFGCRVVKKAGLRYELTKTLSSLCCFYLSILMHYQITSPWTKLTITPSKYFFKKMSRKCQTKALYQVIKKWLDSALIVRWICNSYTMGCPPVCGDNPRALASGLSYVQVDKHGITILYHLHQFRPCTSRDSSW